MPRFIAATYHTKLKVAEFVTDDGRHLLRAGGTLPWRINNCGDLISPVNSRGEPNPKLTRGYLGFAGIPNKTKTKTHHFFIFPDYETGRRELEASLKRKYAEKCIPELVEAYAPSHENESAAYKENLLSSTGIESDKKINELSSEEFARLADAIEKLEGYHNNVESRRETWVPVTSITATDGARPLADEEVILRLNGKETTLRSNAVGQFPPIPHAQEPTEILQRTTAGTLKSVGTIEGEKGKLLSLVKQLQRFAGMSAPDNPPADANGQKHAFVYHVQPGDTLSSIAKRFRTSVEQIKLDNSRRGDKLFAGEVLGIYEPISQGDTPSKVPHRTTPKAKPIDSTARSGQTYTRDQTQETLATRADAGEGKPLALIPTDQRTAPWMVYAIAEAKRLKGMTETAIEASGTNYHKGINDGIKSMDGKNNAWCAAFVNWCLMQAGYPIENIGFHDSKFAKARAHSFYKVSGPKGEQGENGSLKIRNPLFIQLDEPIYGAIALEVSPSDNGLHVGFVYAQQDKNNYILLGGNQMDRVKFSTFNRNPVKPIVETRGGKTVTKAGKPDHLLFFIPTSYREQAKKDNTTMIITTSEKLNSEFGITTEKNQKETTR